MAYPREVTIEPTESNLREQGYSFDTENDDPETLNEFLTEQGFQRRQFILEDASTVIPKGFVVVSNDDLGGYEDEE